MSSRPVFFDPTGQRTVWLKRFLVTLGTIATIGATLFVLSLLAVPLLTPSGESAAVRIRHLLPSVPKRQQQMSLLLLNREREALWREIDKEPGRKAAKPALTKASQGDAPIVAAFYAPWQDTGLASFRAEAKHLTHIMPVWLQLDETGRNLDLDDFDLTVNPKNREVIATAVANGVAIHPILSNAHNGNFDAARVTRLLDSPEAQHDFATEVRDWLQSNHFQGLNLDFENLAEKDYNRLPQFAVLLAKTLHASGLSLSVDLEAGVKVEAMQALAQPCDFAVLMAYNEHDPTGGPGPIASWKWSAQLVSRVAQAIPPQKLVLGVGNYAYDWTENSKDPADSLTYQSALLSAQDDSGKETAQQAVDFDAEQLNSTFQYEEDGKTHQVWILDAASAYNQWQLRQRLGLRGGALWVLGAEDPGVWSFFRRTPDPAFHTSKMETVQFPHEVEFVGNGEILKVISTPKAGQRKLEFDLQSGLCTDEEYTRFPASFVIQRSGFAKHQLALTFDDGPDPEWTPQILDVLKKYDVHATFFMMGQNAERNTGLVRRVWDEGHDIGNHTFTHTNLGLASPRRVALEINATQRAIQSITGHSTHLFRPPYNADAEPQTAEEVQPVVQAAKLGYLTIGEFIDPQDWNPVILDADGDQVPRSVQNIVSDTLRGAAAGKGNVILMHDAGGDRAKTVAALEQLIPALQKKGFHFRTISQLARQPRAVLMPAITGRQRMIVGFDGTVFNIVFSIRWLLTVGFLAAIVLGIARVVLVMPLALAGRFRERCRRFNPAYAPPVTVTIAAYNEAAVIERTVRSILASDYPNFEIIVVDDGSTDGTGDVVENAFTDEPRVRLLRQENGGKAAALNNALSVASGEVYVGFDADTQVAPDAIRLLVRHFANERIGAVAGNVKVGNRLNILTRWQAIEYITSQNLDRCAYGLLNALTVVPGAIGAWRRSAVSAVGGYTPDTLAEDMDLTWRLRQAGWRIVNENAAHAYTEAPDSMGALFKQRFRWAYGTLQCLAKHRGSLGRYGWFGALALPGIWIFQFALQWLAPCVDLQLGYALVSVVTSVLQQGLAHGLWHPLPATVQFLQKTGFFYALFFAIELAGATLAVRLDREKPSLLWWLFWQRFVYRQMLYIVIWKATWTAMRGFRQGWGTLARKGTVSLPNTPIVKKRGSYR